MKLDPSFILNTKMRARTKIFTREHRQNLQSFRLDKRSLYMTPKTCATKEKRMN
jgi:hypothetical protein